MATRKVEEPGEGTLMLGTVNNGGTEQMEMYHLDGTYRRDMVTDFDIVGEVPKKETAIAPMEMLAPTGIQNRNGVPMHVFAPIDFAENHPIPPLKILPVQHLDGYKRLIIRETPEELGAQKPKKYSDETNYDDNDNPIGGKNA